MQIVEGMVRIVGWHRRAGSKRRSSHHTKWGTGIGTVCSYAALTMPPGPCLVAREGGLRLPTLL